jgi:hypothetical protein
MRLKDDDVAELLDSDDVPVVYDFDRSHENIEDRYWAAAKEQGYQMRFDAKQVLDVIFIYVRPTEDFAPIDRNLTEDIHFFKSVAEVEIFAASGTASVTKGRPEANREWARIELKDMSIHYEYLDGQLSLITLVKRK